MLKKCIIIILIILLALTYLSNKTYAMDNIIGGGDSFLAAAGNTSVIDEQELSKTSNDIYNILFTIAVVLAFAIGMVIGIQFIIGGVAEQAKIKETLVPYVIGVFIVFAAFTIWKIAINIGNDVAPVPERTNEITDENTPERTQYCKNCGKQLTESAYHTRNCRTCGNNADTFGNYCGNCGKPLTESGSKDGKCRVCQFYNK